MTLGGIAVAVGELVDDAIVDVENIHRRLRENAQKPAPEPVLAVVYAASREVRNSVVYATLIVCLVVTPLFALSGLEGRMFAPLGLAYLVSLLASLAVSLTVTPVLASLLLGRVGAGGHGRDPLLLRGLKWADARLLRWTLRRPRLVLVFSLLLSASSLFMVFGWGPSSCRTSTRGR
jgi:Cu/Ag efflux pump CusA